MGLQYVVRLASFLPLICIGLIIISLFFRGVMLQSVVAR